MHVATVAVVGAGAGGLVAAGVLRRAGHRVVLFEAKERVGGCASRFSVGPFTFLAGATTVVGLEPDMPLGRVLAELGVSVPATPIERPLTVWHRGAPLVLSTDVEANARTLSARYGAAVGRFSRACVEIGRGAWSLSLDAPFPPRGPVDLARLATSGPAWRALPYLAQTARTLLDRCGETSDEARALLDELLVISTQAGLDDTPALFAAIGIEYLQRTLFAPVGGLGGLLEAVATQLVEQGVELRTKAEVQRVVEGAHGFSLLVGDETFAADAVVLDLTHWDAARLVEGPAREGFVAEAARHPRGPGAVGLYLGVDDVFPRDATPYHQLVLDAPLEGLEARSLFVTLSPPDDPAWAPPGQRAITVSGHVDADAVARMDDAAHAAFKQRVEQAIRAALHHTFPALAGAREHRALAATPRTWARFTGRAHGRVGGLPFTFGTLTRRYPSGLTRSPRLVRVGDTVFPGQSVVAVATGARRVARVLAERL